MDCRQCKDNISAYIDGQIDGSLTWAMEQHLNECPECRNEYDVILKLKEMCAELGDVELPSGFHSCLVERLKRKESEGVIKKINRRINRRVLAGVAAAIIVVFGVGLALSRLGSIGGVHDRTTAESQVVPPVYDAAGDMASVNEKAAGYNGYGGAVDVAEAPEEGWVADDGAGGGINGSIRGMEGDMMSKPGELLQGRTSGGAAGFDSAAAAEYDKAAAETAGLTQAPVESQAEGDRKIIRSAYLSLETTDFDRTVDEIIGRVGVYLGYVESSEIQGKPKQYEGQVSNRKAHFEIRVPAKSFHAFIDAVGELGNVISQQMRGEDITGQYLDVEARLKSLKLQEERLLTLLGKAEALQDIIELERELSRIRYEIENYTGTLKQWDKLVQYSRISIDVYEVREIKKEEPEPITWGDRIINGFIKSWELLGRLFADLVVFVVSAIPYLVVLAGVGWILWAIFIRSGTSKLNRRSVKLEEYDKLKEEEKEEDHEK